jgi:hypothetical protein
MISGSIFIFNSRNKLKIFIIILFAILVNASGIAQSPLNWSRDEINPGEDFTLSPEESFFSEGLKSCHIQLNSGAVPYLVSDVFYITPGEEYVFSIDVFDNDTAGQVKVYADFYDTYGFDIFGQPPVFSSDSSAWQTISWEGVAPSQAIVGFVLIKFYNQPDLYNFTKTAHVWIDHVRFREAGGNNLVANGGFEEWIVGIDESDSQAGLISVFPNPAVDFVTISVQSEADIIFISDITGRMVLKMDAAGKDIIQANISHLPQGIYIVKAILQNNSVIARKLLIN